MGHVAKMGALLNKNYASNKKKFYSMIQHVLIEKGLLLYIIGLLLGRAVILYNISPFAIAFLATVWAMYQQRIYMIVAFILIGAWTYSVEHAVFITLSLGCFLILTRFLSHRLNMKYLILFVFFSTMMTRVFLYSLPSKITVYELLHVIMEGTLGAILLLIFMQSVPLISLNRYQPTLKNEELICIIILIASVLTGLIGWDIYIVSLEHVLSRYIVLIFAFVGGAAIGSTVGVVAGLILSLAHVVNLYQMSLLAFSGLLGGMLKEGKKHGAALGLLVGSFLVGMYGGLDTLSSMMLESIFAIFLFYLTPHHVLKHISRYIPGTSDYSYEERKYLQKIRDITAERVEQFSSVFDALSKSFIQSTDRLQEQNSTDETDYFLSSLTKRTCQMCFMKNRCWQKKFDETYSLMDEMKESYLTHNELDIRLKRKFQNHCIKSHVVMEIIQDEVSLLKVNRQLKKQVVESKKLVADQLKGVSDIMDNFAQEMMQERKTHEKQEIDIVRALKKMDIHIESIDIYNLEKGNIDIEMTAIFHNYHGEAAKLIAPVLTNILDETIVVQTEKISSFPSGVSLLTFGSAQRYIIETGIATAAKGGGLVSGDSYTTMELGKGKYTVAISDGMGNGMRANEESAETLRLLEQILQTGISEKVAIQSINSILALRTTDEIFATLDLAIFNLHNGHSRFLKVSSIPSFIKRGEDVLKIEANNLPIGIIEHVELETVSRQLKPGDIVIMMSDGVFDGPKHIKNNDVWMTRKIRHLKTSEPQEIADLLLEEVIREEQGEIRDDMTIVVSKVTRHIPKWAAIPVYHYEAK